MNVLIADTSLVFVGQRIVDGIYEIVLPKNTVIDSSEKDSFATNEFMPELEKFIHSYMKATKKSHSPIKIKRANENGEFDEINIHSTKFDAWYVLDRALKKSIINKPSKMHKYSNLFNSRTIERTISRGLFLMSENNSPIFNQGLLDNDDSYKIHFKDDLYSFGAFVLREYNKLININANINSDIVWLAKKFSSKYGFKKEFNINDKKTKNQFLSILENITKRIQPKTTDIKDLENAIRKVIFGNNIIVGIDDFQYLWEELVSGAMKKTYGNNNIFVEEDMCNYKDNGYRDEENLYPDIVYINNKDIQETNHSLHILDPKYKFFGDLENDEWIKQILYIQNFLNPDINKQIKVDTNLYFIYPSFGKVHKIQANYKTFQMYKIPLDYMKLLKVYNNRDDINGNTLFKFLDEMALIQPNYIFKPWIPECCTYDNAQKVHTVANNKYKKYENYMSNKQEFNNLINKYFKTKSIEEFKNSTLKKGVF